MEGKIPLIDSLKPYTISTYVRVFMGKGNEKKDAGQSYLPYFDSQNIELSIPAPLSGLQLIYYKNDNYAGFVRPRISPINYLDYLLWPLNGDENHPRCHHDGMFANQDWNETRMYPTSSSELVHPAKNIVLFALLIAVISYF